MPKPPLNADQVRVVQLKQVSLNRPIGELLDILGPVAKWDAAGDTSRKKLGCIGPSLIVVSLFVLFVNTIPYHIVLGLGMLVIGVVVVVVWNRKKSEDLSDNLRVCAVPLLAALREDFGDGPIEVKLDLRPPMSPAKQTSKEKVNKVTMTTYTDPWMSGEGVLHDGSRLRWSVVETITEKSYWKRGSSGKSKLKTKRKKRVEIDVDLTLKAKTYGEKQTLHGEAKIKRDTVDPIPPDEIINVVAGLYKQLHPTT